MQEEKTLHPKGFLRAYAIVSEPFSYHDRVLSFISTMEVDLSDCPPVWLEVFGFILARAIADHILPFAELVDILNPLIGKSFDFGPVCEHGVAASLLGETLQSLVACKVHFLYFFK